MPEASIIDVVWMTTVMTAMCTMVTIGLILIIRLRRHYLASRHSALRAQWHPILCRSMMEEVDVLPPLAQRDYFSFLWLWLSLHESVTGEARKRLHSLALRLNVDQIALRLVDADRLKPRLLAVAALGHLRVAQAWPRLLGVSRHTSAALSLAASQALVEIDAGNALPLLVPLFGSRHEWSLVKIIQILRGTNVDIAARLLARTAMSADSPDAARLIRLIEGIRGAPALPQVREIIRAHPNDAMIIPPALRLLGECRHPCDLPIVRDYTTHPNWIIRLHAVSALGKIGTIEDAPRLIALLADERWWVRYRAAESLSHLPMMTPHHLADIRARCTETRIAGLLDPFLDQLRYEFLMQNDRHRSRSSIKGATA